jgi:hypothetical protein
MTELKHLNNQLSDTFMFHFGGHGSWARLLGQGAIKVNGEKVSTDMRINSGDELAVGRNQLFVIGSEVQSDNDRVGP